MRTLLLLLLVLPAAAQEPTAAEKLFRDAWWLETGAGEIEKALAKYLSAADAAGPASVRAKALLRVATLQKRLGDTEKAIRSLERLTTSFASDTETVGEAQRKLREWTAVDIRDSFSEWYRRHLFSAEYQAKVVDLVHQLGTQLDDSDVGDIEDELTTLGEAAVPALREAVRSRNERLVARAARILLELGVLPPAPVLLAHRDWIEDEQAWLAVMHAPEADRATLRDAIRDPDPFARLLQAAAAGPEAVFALVRSEAGGVLALESRGVLEAALWGLHATGDPATHRQILELAVASDAPLGVRRLVERLVDPEFAFKGMGAGDWLAWARRVYGWEPKKHAVRLAARLLRPGDDATLDALIGYVADMDRELVAGLLEALGDGLAENGVPLQLAWTPQRVRALMVLAVRSGAGTVAEALAPLRFETDPGAAVVEALLDRPAEWTPLLDQSDFDLMACLRERADPDSPEGILLEARWGRTVLATLRRRWDGWDAEARYEALVLVSSFDLVHDERAPAALVEFLKEQAAAATDEKLRAKLRDTLGEFGVEEE